MKKSFILGFCLLALSIFLIINGCDKEKIVESTEYIHEYVEVPGDTVFQVDTVYASDSLYTVDTLIVTETEYVYDTVTEYQTIYDTTFITDTVVNGEGGPNEFLAMTALEYYCDDLVMEVIYTELGYTDGWIFYLSSFQLDLTTQSSTVYDLYGFIDYWKGDWSDFAAFEYYWRMVYNGGDPTDPNNWTMTEPASPTSGHNPGLNKTTAQPQPNAIWR
jgi:hypothetical protein